MRNTVSVTITERLGNAEKTVDVAFYFDPANDGSVLFPASVETTAEPVSGASAGLVRKGRTRNPDGTVTDHDLRLEWSDVLRDADGDPRELTHEEAEKACAAIAIRDGWRLPTRVELLSLVDDTRHEPAIDTTLFPNTPSRAFWTSMPAAWSPSSLAWCVDFDGGYAYCNHRSYKFCVRAVRSVSPSGQ